MVVDEAREAVRRTGSWKLTGMLGKRKLVYLGSGSASTSTFANCGTAENVCFARAEGVLASILRVRISSPGCGAGVTGHPHAAQRGAKLSVPWACLSLPDDCELGAGLETAAAVLSY